MAQFKATLMCGLTATNHILKKCNAPAISAETMQLKAEEMAEKESAVLYSCSPGTVHDLATDPRGNYALSALLHVIQSHSNLFCKAWLEKVAISTNFFTRECGQHLQAVIQDSHD